MSSMRWPWVADHSDDLFANSWDRQLNPFFFFPLALFVPGAMIFSRAEVVSSVSQLKVYVYRISYLE